MGINVIVAATAAEARDKHAEYRHASPRPAWRTSPSSSGIGLSRYGLDEPIRYEKNNAIESVVKNLTVARTGSVRKLLDQLALGDRYVTLVGDPRQVADDLEGWIADTGLDGFNLTRTVEPSYADFIDLVVPELRARGSYKTAYAPGTLREKLFGGGRARLQAEHAGAAFRQHPAVHQQATAPPSHRSRSHHAEHLENPEPGRPPRQRPGQAADTPLKIGTTPPSPRRWKSP